MIDINLIREKPEWVKAQIARLTEAQELAPTVLPEQGAGSRKAQKQSTDVERDFVGIEEHGC